MASAAARSLFQEGVACADGGDWACAADRFQRAYALRASPVIGTNLGIALTHLDRLVEAAEALRAVLRDPSSSTALRAEAQESITELEVRLAHLVVHAEGARDDVSFTIDGRALAPSLLDVAAPADPGDHVVEARRGVEIVASATAHLDPGGTGEVTLLVPAAPPPPPEPEPEAEPEPVALSLPPPVLAPPPAPAPRGPEIWEEWWLWTLVGVVVVGAGVGIGVGVALDQPSALPSGSLGTIDGR